MITFMATNVEGPGILLGPGRNIQVVSMCLNNLPSLAIL